MIWLASFPRSGNKFVQLVLHHVFHLPVRTVYELPADEEDIAPTWDGAEEDVFVKTHDLPDVNDASIYIYRDPRDCYCSFAQYSMQTNPEHAGLTIEQSIEQLLRDHPFAPWHRRCSDPGRNSVVIDYSDLLADPIKTVWIAVEWFGLSCEIRGSLPSFEQLHFETPWYFQAGRVGRWVDEISEDLAARICYSSLGP